MKVEKLMGAGMKAGGAAASATCVALFWITSGGHLTNGGLAIMSGLSVSSAVLAKQAISDAIEAFKPDEE